MSGKYLVKMDRNNTNFQLKLFEYLRNAKFGDEYSFLKYYQNIVRIFINDIDIDSRGLLISFTMGLGKSIQAIAIAMDLIKERPPILLLTKSLQENMRQSIIKYVKMRSVAEPDYYLGRLSPEDLDKWILRNFSFVSMNASNMLRQVGKAAEGDVGKEFDVALEEKIGEVLKFPSLDGKLLIVDEAHNLFRAITNGSSNAKGLYDLVMKSRNLKIIFLTGTPISNDPFELVPCFNMLGSKRPGVLTLPESYRDFYDLYVDKHNGRVKNRGKFQNRIFGLVSHVSHLSTPGVAAGISDTSSEVLFPEELETKVVNVNMTPEQWVSYQLARDKEKEEGVRGRRVNEAPALQKPKSGAQSSYRVKSRQLSNYLPGATSSPKYDAVIQNINDRPGQLGLVYSQFVGEGGLGSFIRALKADGYTEYTLTQATGGNYIDNINKEAEKSASKWWEGGTRSILDEITGGASSKTFAVISGRVDPLARAAIQDVFNSPENTHGEIISLLLISATGAEGLDLKNIRHIHIIEPYWNYGRLAQIKSRGIRNDSHKNLPKDEQNVQTYIYLSLPPESEIKDQKERTTDVELYEDAVTDQVLITDFINATDEVSIECLLNGEKNCRTCAPTGKPLYTSDYMKDVRAADPCTSMEEAKVTANQILVDGVEYYYAPADNIFGNDIFIYNEEINAYKQVPENDPVFMRIIDAINAQ